MLRPTHHSTSAGSWLVVSALALVLAIAPLAPATSVCARLEAQTVPTVVLKSPASEHQEPMTQPGMLLELGDGRVLVSDTRERTLVLYDFASGAANQLSRMGAGPLEYQFPSGIFASGDSIVVIDMMLQRMLVLDRRATPVRTHRLVESGDALGAILKVGTIVALDERGHFYSESRGVHLVPGQMPTTSDTVALVRWTSLGVRGDTVAVRVDPAPVPRMSGGAAEGVRIKLPIVAMQPRDAWAVFASGRVAVARASDYHTDWSGGSALVAGPRVPYAPVPVTEADKERVRKNTRDAAEQGLKLGVSMASGSGQKMPKLSMEVEEPPSWPKVKPPFSGVRAAPDGRLWVARPLPGATDAVEYDVLAPGGKLARRVRFPPNVTLLGFGKGTVYATRRDEDDLRYLQRYRLP